VPTPIRLNANGTTRPAEGTIQPTFVSQPSIK
jgi:hypothetical protein